MSAAGALDVVAARLQCGDHPVAMVALHLWRRNALLSIVGGTLVNVVVVSLVLPS